MAIRHGDVDDSDVSDAIADTLRSTSPASALGKRKQSSGDKAISKRAAKRKKSDIDRNPADDVLDIEHGINRAIALMDSQLLADHIAQRTQRFQSDLSMMELEELRIPASAIVDTSSFHHPRNLENLPDYLQARADSSKRPGSIALDKASKRNGQPHTLVVAGAGLRAADLTRALRKFQSKDARVEKLFAKHIKIKEAIESLRKSRVGIGVGTPQRVADLLDHEALMVGSLERIVVDASHIDVKKRGILDMRETEVPLIKLLCRKEFRELYEGGKLGILFY